MQVPQPGAQNQNTVGVPATVDASNVPPPINGAVNCKMSGVSVAGALTPGSGWLAGVAVSSAPHAANDMTATPSSTRRKRTGTG